MQPHAARVRIVLGRRYCARLGRQRARRAQPTLHGGATTMSGAAPLKHADAKALRKAALVYPDTVEDFPWDHHAFKAPNKKTFLFLTGQPDGGFNCSMKLPFRNHEALLIKSAEPTG